MQNSVSIKTKKLIKGLHKNYSKMIAVNSLCLLSMQLSGVNLCLMCACPELRKAFLMEMLMPHPTNDYIKG